MSKTLNDLRDYAISRGMCERNIERLIDETETDDKGNVLYFEDICFGIDCEVEY